MEVLVRVWRSVVVLLFLCLVSFVPCNYLVVVMCGALEVVCFSFVIITFSLIRLQRVYCNPLITFTFIFTQFNDTLFTILTELV